MRYRLSRAVRDLTGADLYTRLSGFGLKKFAAADLKNAIGYFGLATHRDLKQLQIEVASYRNECRELEHDMRYAKSINADLGLRNCRLTERNDFLELRNRELESRNHDLEELNPRLEAENARLKKQNHWLYYGSKCKEPGRQTALLERLSSSRDASMTTLS